jgi:hypothetical protein
MGVPRSFTGRKEHRRGDLVHFAEVTVQAEPCLGARTVGLGRMPGPRTGGRTNLADGVLIYAKRRDVLT